MENRGTTHRQIVFKVPEIPLVRAFPDQVQTDVHMLAELPVGGGID